MIKVQTPGTYIRTPDLLSSSKHYVLFWEDASVAGLTKPCYSLVIV